MIIVTGGCGFIGSNLCDHLVKIENESVICIDNLYTGSIDNIKDLVIQNDLEKNVFSIIKKDICNANLYEILKSKSISFVFNLACPASPVHYQHNPVFTLKTATVGLINLLEFCKDKNINLLHTSTSEIYGNPMVHPQPEYYWGNVNPTGPRSCYDEGKRCGEALIVAYNSQYKMQNKIVRIFNTYGPNMAINDGRVISNFIIQALRNENITVYGNGLQTRSFCYVDDMIEALIKMYKAKNFTGPVNLGNPCEVTILEVAEKILDIIKPKNSKIIFKPLPKDDPIKRKPDISLAQKKLNWKPKTSLEDGLLKTIEYFKKKLFYFD